MKAIYFTFVITLSSLMASSQAGQWVWLKGSNTSNSQGNPGTMGVPGPTVEPPALYEACEWTDNNGNFWLYGGTDSTQGLPRNDLWKYDPTTNEWEWVSGTHAYNDPGVYGIQGVAAATNRPPSRGYGVASWTDQAGNLWMFGGCTLAPFCFNDLWKYDISTNMWTWMKGPKIKNDPGSYGTQGVPNASNCPGSRYDTHAAWTDNAGDLWLFGGWCSGGGRNDLWRFNIAANTWTWMNGSSTFNQPSQYGALGVESPSNTPGSREIWCRWKDHNGNLWLFGGIESVQLNNVQVKNDLWRYNPITNNWAWMNGATIGFDAGLYGTKCVAESYNRPPARWGNHAAWTDVNGNLWMFGGGDSINSNYNENLCNHLWMYCIDKNQWIWEGGDSIANPAGNWGTKNVSSPTNKPDGRAGALAWTDKSGRLYLFGGTDSLSAKTHLNIFNDLWQYTIDPSCASCGSILPPTASFQSGDSNICTNDCINFNNFSINATSYKWIFAGATPATDTTSNPQNICYLAPGRFDVTLIATNSGSSDSLTISNLINVASSPITPVITLAGTTLYTTTDSTYTSYQWYDSSIIIPGAIDTFLVITHAGNYNVQVTNKNGCKIAVGINVVLGSEQLTAYGLQLTVNPNPVMDELNVKGYSLIAGSTLSIFNILGQRIYTNELKSKEETINCKPFPPGIYFVQVQNEKQNWIIRFMKE